MSGEVRAPGLDAGLAWLNTDRPLRFGHELKGQIVVLDFWTYCCINCMHILPDLAYLEDKYRNDPVTFVGVHSAKFTNEASTETIRQAILRYEIQHPVIIDDQMKIWRAYAVRSWPTVVVIDSCGSIAASLAGEGNRDAMDRTIGEALAQGRTNETLARAPLALRREGRVQAASSLAFPGKVLADVEGNRLFVSDSNHNRIVISRLPDEWGRAEVLAVVGTGHVGSTDGPADRASFNRPQGMAIGQGNLYVADTENHLLRAISLETFEVRTVVGTGKMTYDWSGGLMGTQQGINSPWDLTIEGSTLYVAMAGTHQIWRVEMPVGFARALAGTGRENLADGPTETSAFAQPSGICALKGKLYVADSEVSAIRGIDMASEKVFTVIGEGLFSFGDVDGVPPQAKLQHPLGIAAWGSSLVVADTYNHKIKLLDPSARTIRTAFGMGTPATTTNDGAIAFFEPGGVSVAGDELFVADTNNHRIVRVHLRSKAWCEVVFVGLREPRVIRAGNCEHDESPTVKVGPISVASKGEVELDLEVMLPDGARWNEEASWSVRVMSGEATIAQKTGRSATPCMKIAIPPVAWTRAGEGDWDIISSFVYCLDGATSRCVPARVAWRACLRTGGATTLVRLKGQVDTRVLPS